jgi:hypothetical protein
MIHDAGGEIYACKASVDMFHLKKDDFCSEVDGVVSVGQFYEKAAGGQINLHKARSSFWLSMVVHCPVWYLTAASAV